MMRESRRRCAFCLQRAIVQCDGDRCIRQVCADHSVDVRAAVLLPDMRANSPGCRSDAGANGAFRVKSGRAAAGLRLRRRVRRAAGGSGFRARIETAVQAVGLGDDVNGRRCRMSDTLADLTANESSGHAIEVFETQVHRIRRRASEPSLRSRDAERGNYHPVFDFAFDADEHSTKQRRTS
jgi:hypothetical protein